MIDFGFDKLALIGVVALVVIGPERLPKVARTVGHLVGKAQRYVADVKAEVNRSMELEELRKMRSTVEDAARDISQSVQQEIQSATQSLENAWHDSPGSADAQAIGHTPSYKPPRKQWRLKRSAMPSWYKRDQGVRTKAQSGAARVARFRPKNLPRNGL